MSGATGKTFTLGWNHGVLAVERFGGRLGPLLFLLPDGRQVAPLFVAPWFDAAADLVRQPLLHRLRGEWPCIPFGFDRDRPAAFEWPASSAGQAVDVGHGYGASHDWELLEHTSDCIKLAIAYPLDHPIARLERAIRPVPDLAAIDLFLTIEARADCLLPIGLHPTFAAPSTTGRWFIDLPAETLVATCPYPPTPLSVLAPGAFAPIASVPARDGGTIDARFFPPPQRSEDLVQVLAAKGWVGIVDSGENYRLDLTWQAEHFPSLLLWISNKAIADPPWSGRTMAFGVEPICSAFDFGRGVSGQDNPISRRGVATARRFRAGETFATSYRLAADLF